MTPGWFLRLQVMHDWWYRLQARRVSRLAALRHLAAIADALFTGSTQAYTFIRDLPRAPDSTRIEW